MLIAFICLRDNISKHYLNFIRPIIGHVGLGLHVFTRTMMHACTHSKHAYTYSHTELMFSVAVCVINIITYKYSITCILISLFNYWLLYL